jgi:hypothetical protein
LQPSRRFPCRLNRRKKQTDENADNGDDDEQLYEGESFECSDSHNKLLSGQNLPARTTLRSVLHTWNYCTLLQMLCQQEITGKTGVNRKKLRFFRQISRQEILKPLNTAVVHCEKVSSKTLTGETATYGCG